MSSGSRSAGCTCSLAVVAIVVLLATGAAMASHFDRWSERALQLKLGLVALVAGVLIWQRTVTSFTR